MHTFNTVFNQCQLFGFFRRRRRCKFVVVKTQLDVACLLTVRSFSSCMAKISAAQQPIRTRGERTDPQPVDPGFTGAEETRTREWQADRSGLCIKIDYDEMSKLIVYTRLSSNYYLFW